VRLESHGHPIYRQHRVGKDGHGFEVIKLRTMVTGAEHMGAGMAVDEGDSRITRVGAFLRRTSIDELPNVVNVLRGEMSLIGPRPERPEFVDRFTKDVDRYGERHRFKSGMTGLAQVHGLRGKTSIADRVAYDNHYVEHWSPWLDVKILVRTVRAVFAPAE
jgi:lipopolysaccharide/colanic/teichoic acid biosynthesis glycosyltransferase